MTTRPRAKAKKSPSPARRKGARPVKTRKRKAPPPGERLKVAILSRKASLYSTSRLVEAVRAHGHEALVLDTLRCDLLAEKGRPKIYYEGEELSGISVVLPRIGASITRYGLAVVRQLESMGVPALNGSDGISRSRDKLRCIQLLAQAGIDVPRTVMMRERAHLEGAVDRIGGLPVIVKLLQGTQGVGVMLAHSFDELESMLDTMWNLEQEILLQEFVAESRGRDVRALVVGDRVVGAMRRTARVQGEFRSNIHRGGLGELIELPESFAREAVRAARVVGLEVAGVDLLESSSGPRIAEVNSSPGIEGLERASGVDVAEAIVAHAIRLATSTPPPHSPRS